MQLSYGGVDSSGQLKKAISFDGFEDLLNFWSCHKIRAGFDASLWNDGTFHISAGPVSSTNNFSNNHTFYGGMPDTWSINIEVDNWEIVNNYTVTAPRKSSSGDFGLSGSGGGAIVTDHTVFEELLGKKEIVINNVD